MTTHATGAWSPAAAGIDLTDLGNFAGGFPHEMFAIHRREAPVAWHEPTRHTPDGEGFWSVATHAETLAVLRDPVTYSSERGGERPYGGTLIQDLPVAGSVLNMMDDPRHARIRRLVNVGMTPRTITRLEGELRRRTRALLAAVPEGEPFDFLTGVAAELPTQMICILLGVPEEDRHALFAAVEPGFDIREDAPADAPARDEAAARRWMHAYGARLIAAKRAEPGDDMLSTVVHATLADVDPPALTDTELYMFFSLLFSAGAETTRNAIAGGLLALLERPAVFSALVAGGPAALPGAIEEMLRWTTPSPAKRRTVTRPAELGGRALSPGEKVVVWEGSANRDERVFAGPHDFDIARDPNPHLAFGFGIHYCLGANLARLEMRVLFEELFAAFPDPGGYALDRPAEWTRSNRHTGIRHLWTRLEGRARTP